MTPLALAGAAPPFFTEIAALIVAGAVIAYLCYRVGLVPIVGFLVAGVAIGPNGLGLVQDRELVDAAAEVGVILLLFTIGIEFSFERLARIRRLIFGAGGLQVALALGLTAGLLIALGVDWRPAVFTGMLVALSSTAIVLKLLEGRGETASEHGQAAVGILIFQDLAIIPMVLLVPVLGGAGGSAAEIAGSLLRAAAIIAVVLLFARRLMPRLLEVVARTCSPELFLLSVIAVCFGTAWVTSLAGVSLSLGAFLAGLLVSESRFSEHALGEILPLQILFSATFFVSVGMLLDLRFLFASPLLVAGAVAGVLLVKAATTAVSVRALGYPLPVAAASALTLAQIGEFSFVLERAGREAGLAPAGLAETGSQAFIATAVVLMVLTPALAALASRVAARPAPAAPAAPGEEPAAAHLPRLEGHVVVAGYGAAARRITRSLRAAVIPFAVTTLSPEGATEAEAEGFPVLRGDSARQRTLELVGADRARLLVVADDDPAMAHRIASVARALSPRLRILVRTRHAADAEALEHAGADRVVSEEAESVAGLLEAVLGAFEVEPERVRALAGAARRDRASAAPAPAPPAEGRLAAYVDPEREVRFTPAAGAACAHLDRIRAVHPGTRGCEECLRSGDPWVHLRICLTCGHVGCCDSSPNRHASAHFHASGHPLMRSLEPGETWAWCYVDGVALRDTAPAVSASAAAPG